MKFKVGDKVRVREDLVIGSCYGKERFVDGMKEYKGQIFTIKKIYGGFYIFEKNLFNWTDEMLEKVKKEKETQEKTFREVIADIKEGEVWECGHILITKSNDGIELKGMSSYSSYFTDDNKIFKLQRKEYTFEEAFKAYEEGKEIESCEVLTGCYPSKYKRIANKDAQWREESYSWDKRKYIGIPFYEVRGKWYINN